MRRAKAKVDDCPSPAPSSVDLRADLSLAEAFRELLNAVEEAIRTTVFFNSIFDGLKSTLTSFEPAIKELDSKQMKFEVPEPGELIEHMSNGVKLVRKCSTFTHRHSWKKHRYAKKLQSLNDNISRFFQIYVPLIASRDIKETLVEARNLRKIMRKLSLMNHDGNSFKRTNGGSESYAAPMAPDYVVGLDVSFQNLKKQLLAEGFSATVVTGPGGIGKTTLVKKLCHDAEVKEKFEDNIFFVPASRYANWMVMIQKIILYMGKNVTDIKTKDDAIYQLQQLLHQIEGPILLVLDDIWPESEDLLSKLVLDMIPDYKILVTSRFEFPSFGHTHRLDQLRHPDALQLFSYFAMCQDGISQLPDEELIDKIVSHCSGLPLALTVVAKSLSGMHPSIWQSRLLEWSEGVSMVDSNSDILLCLQRSLDDLDNVPLLKECFMDLGAFPADHVIPTMVLIDMWVELYNLDAEGVQASSILSELASRSLANLLITRKDTSEGDGIYSDVFVTQHDLLRELAIHQNSQQPMEQRERLNLEIHGDKFPDWWTEEQLLPLKARLVSISTDALFSSVWPNIELPAVEVLVLNLCAEKYTLPPFMEKMTNLKSLVITNNAFFPAEISNFPVLDSLPNLRRVRLERIKVPSLNMSCIRLVKLERASFFMCNISQELMAGIQVQEALPNLAEIDISYSNDLETLPEGICDIVTLRKISVTNCHNLAALPNQIGSLMNLEVLRFNSCTSLLGLPESIEGLENLSFLDISDCFSIQKLPDQIGELSKLKELNINGCLGLSQLPSTINKLEQLKYAICDAERAILWRSIKHFLPKLQIKVIEEDINLNWLRIR